MTLLAPGLVFQLTAAQEEQRVGLQQNFELKLVNVRELTLSRFFNQIIAKDGSMSGSYTVCLTRILMVFYHKHDFV